MKASHFVAIAVIIGVLTGINSMIAKEKGSDITPSEAAWGSLIADEVKKAQGKDNDSLDFIPSD